MGNVELRNRNFSTAFCSIFHMFHMFHIWSHFLILKTQFSIFSNAFSKRIFRFFQKTVKKNAKKVRFENARGKNVKNAF